MNARYRKLMSTMEREQKLMGDVPEFQETLCQEIGVLDDRISAEELDLLEKKQAMEEISWRRGEVPKLRDTDVAEGRVTWMAAAGSRSSEAEGHLFVSEVGVHQKDTEDGQKSFGQVKAPVQKRRAVIRVESAERQDYVSAPPLTSGMGTDMEELSFVPSAVSEHRWALRVCANKCREKNSKFCYCVRRRRRSAHD